MQCLKGRPATRIDRNYLSVQDHALILDGSDSAANGRVSLREVLVITRSDLDVAAGLDRDGPVAIELYLIQPAIAFRKLRNEPRLHRRDELREAIALGGFPPHR